jgi:hypothetical protein
MRASFAAKGLFATLARFLHIYSFGIIIGYFARKLKILSKKADI